LTRNDLVMMENGLYILLATRLFEHNGLDVAIPRLNTSF